MANLWNSNLLPLFPQDMLAFMSCCCWPTSLQLSISCISKNVTLSLRRYHISLKSKTVPLSRSWKVQPTLQILVWSTTIPKAEGFSYLLPDRVQDVLAEDNLGGQLAPSNQCWMYFTLCAAITVLQIDAQAIMSYLCVFCHMLLLLEPIFPGFACLSLSRVILLAKGFGTGTCDYFFFFSL